MGSVTKPVKLVNEVGGGIMVNTQRVFWQVEGPGLPLKCNKMVLAITVLTIAI